MGLFGLFKKKTDYFDKKIEPKCVYCEYGQPGRSNKMILCPKCGIVNEDYSCKKFVYSPLKRIPDKVHPTPDPALVNNDKPAQEEKKEAVVSPVINVSEPQEKDETPVASIDAKPQEKTETPVTSVDAKPQEKTETPVASVDAKPQEKSETPVASVDAKPQESPTASPISEIHNVPQNNKENIKKLEEIPEPQLSGIANTVAPKEINLPDVADNAVSSIANSPTERNSEAYLKTVTEQTVSGFVNKGSTTHKLPENTRIPTLSDIK